MAAAPDIPTAVHVVVAAGAVAPAAALLLLLPAAIPAAALSAPASSVPMQPEVSSFAVGR